MKIENDKSFISICKRRYSLHQWCTSYFLFLTSYFNYIICTITQKYVRTALESILIGFFSSIFLFCSKIEGGRDLMSTINIACHVARGPLYLKDRAPLLQISRKKKSSNRDTFHHTSSTVDRLEAHHFGLACSFFLFFRGESTTMADTSCYSNSWLDSGCTIKRAEHLNQITRAFAG